MLLGAGTLGNQTDVCDGIARFVVLMLNAVLALLWNEEEWVEWIIDQQRSDAMLMLTQRTKGARFF